MDDEECADFFSPAGPGCSCMGEAVGFRLLPHGEMVTVPIR